MKLLFSFLLFCIVGDEKKTAITLGSSYFHFTAWAKADFNSFILENLLLKN